MRYLEITPTRPDIPLLQTPRIVFFGSKTEALSDAHRRIDDLLKKVETARAKTLKGAGRSRRLHPLTLEPFRLTGLGTPHTPVTLSYHVCLLTPSVDKNHMRPYVEPPPTLRCSCAGELRLKLIEPADRTRQKQREIFVCTNCGREQTLLADRNPYMASHPHQEKSQRTRSAP